MTQRQLNVGIGLEDLTFDQSFFKQKIDEPSKLLGKHGHLNSFQLNIFLPSLSQDAISSQTSNVVKIKVFYYSVLL